MNGRHGLWAVVPVKMLARSKQRLMPLLSRPERKALARVMLEDVLGALMRSTSLAGVMVVTGDQCAAATARRAGALVMKDANNTGMTAAVTSAARYLAARRCGGMLVVPADVPLITHEDVEMIILTHRTVPSVTLVPAERDGGTNALLCSPPQVIPVRFGEDSFVRHLETARTLGIEPRVLRLQRAGHDIDRPDDLVAFVQAPHSTRTCAYLTVAGIAERLQEARRNQCDAPRLATKAMEQEA
ncbi:MAG: 2-phospho-L-lactate guanylyltransferase [Betaproteobacteria bacterium]|nr:2-phospho-L-lactate guanylyltransferase [Betaproteobacteria bacterium]